MLLNPSIFDWSDISVEYRKGTGVTFLWSHKKVTKESDIGEALRQSLSEPGAYQTNAPAFEPPSPMNPSRQLSRHWAVVDFWKIEVFSYSPTPVREPKPMRLAANV